MRPDYTERSQEMDMEFVIGVVLAAVLFADRLSRRDQVADEALLRDEMRRRLYQVGLAFTLALFLVALSGVMFPLRAGEEISLSLNNDSAEAAFSKVRDRLVFVVAGGVLFLLFGLVSARRSSTIYLSALLAGIIVIATQLFNSGTAANPIFLIYESALTSNQTRNVIYAVVLALGVAALALYGYREWERDASREEDRSLTG
jgi:hypothetical protein